MFDFITLCDYLGTFAFAISGIRVASEKNFDLLGAYICALAPAVGGGTLRDLFLSQTPFWMLNGNYLLVTFLALFLTILFSRTMARMQHTIYVLDTVGLALFTLVGMNKALSLGFPIWVGICMGTITGAGGGVVRDILINEAPVIFRKDIYALACVLGGVVYGLVLLLPIGSVWAQVACVVSVAVCRMLSVHFSLNLPKLGNRVALAEYERRYSKKNKKS